MTGDDLSRGIRGRGQAADVRIRCKAGEREAFAGAAALAGLSLSSWARMVLREAARSALMPQEPPEVVIKVFERKR